MRAPRLTQIAESAGPPVPLVVDLDGALITTNLMVESLFQLAKRKPLALLRVAGWLARGRDCVVRHLWREARPEVATLPFRREVLGYLQEARRRGVPLVLITAADPGLANAVAGELGLFDQVLAGAGNGGTADEGKRDRLIAAFGAGGFDYIGATRSVCDAARKTVSVQPGTRPQAVVAEVGRITVAPTNGLRACLTAMRPRQWLKNALLLVPLLAANQIAEPDLLASALLAVVAFSLCASSAYLLNDLMDLPSDRRHPEKKHRPLASGQLTPARALLLMPLLLAGAGVIGLLVGTAFLGVLALYYILTLTYSFRLKDLVIVDVLALAGLHALRVLAGAAAVAIPPSHWLLTFCVFFFLSLALIKRYAELMLMRRLNGGHARAYRFEDSALLAALGGASGYIAVLVLALYVGSDSAQGLYPRQELIWLVCVLLLYWISYMWLMAHRSVVRDDPLIFALRDRVSQILIVLMGATLIGAAIP